MTVPRFSSPEEADAWMAQQVREKRKAEVAQEIKSCPGPVWPTKRGYRVLYSTTPLSSGKFGVVVFDGDWNEVEPKVVYVREFVRRKDARAKAIALWEKYGGSP